MGKHSRTCLIDGIEILLFPLFIIYFLVTTITGRIGRCRYCRKWFWDHILTSTKEYNNAVLALRQQEFVFDMIMDQTYICSSECGNKMWLNNFVKYKWIRPRLKFTKL